MIRLLFLMLCLPVTLRAQVKPALTLNHIYMVLDDTTFNALSTHEELQRHYGSWDADMP
jgi:hypothetical protein